MKNRNTHSPIFWILLSLIIVTNSLSAQGTWTTKNKKTANLSNPVVTSLFKDSKGSIWAGTVKGVNKFENDQCTNIMDANGLALKRVTGISEDSQKNIWISLMKKGAVKYDGLTWTLYDANNGMSNSKAYCVFADSKGNVWVGTKKGLNKFDGKNWVTYTKKDGLTHNMVTSIYEDKKGNMWFGTANGVTMYNGMSWLKYTTKDGLARPLVWSINEDAAGNMWFGTYSGKFSKFDGMTWESMKKGSGYYNFALLGAGLAEGLVFTLLLGPVYGGIFFVTNAIVAAMPSSGDMTAVYSDSKNNLWLSAMPKGVFKYDGISWTNYTKKDGLVDSRIYSMTEDDKGNMWFGTNKGISVYSK